MKEISVIIMCMLVSSIIVLCVGVVPYGFWGKALIERVVTLEDKVAMYEEIINDDEQR